KLEQRDPAVLDECISNDNCVWDYGLVRVGGGYRFRDGAVCGSGSDYRRRDPLPAVVRTRELARPESTERVGLSVCRMRSGYGAELGSHWRRAVGFRTKRFYSDVPFRRFDHRLADSRPGLQSDLPASLAGR